MALISYVETDTGATFNVGCSGQGAGATTGAREAQVGGTPGTTEVGIDPDNLTTAACFVFDCTPAPNVATWEAGNYVIPINHTAMDAGTELTRADVCDFDGVATYATVATNTSPGHTPGGTGVLNVTVNRATDYTPQIQLTSRVFIVLTYTNTDDHGASSGGITPSETITTPIDDGVTGGGVGNYYQYYRALCTSGAL